LIWAHAVPLRRTAADRALIANTYSRFCIHHFPLNF
jgi:hypothetical protein